MKDTVNIGSKSLTEDWILNYLVSNFPGLNIILKKAVEVSKMSFYTLNSRFKNIYLPL